MDTKQINNNSGSLVSNLFKNDDVIVSGSYIKIPKDKKELLHYYIDVLGWAITPNYGIYKGVCNCFRNKCDKPGKHPRSEMNKITGRNEALSTKDKNKIDEWLNDSNCSG